MKTNEWRRNQNSQQYASSKACTFGEDKRTWFLRSAYRVFRPSWILRYPLDLRCNATLTETRSPNTGKFLFPGISRIVGSSKRSIKISFCNIDERNSRNNGWNGIYVEAGRDATRVTLTSDATRNGITLRKSQSWPVVLVFYTYYVCGSTTSPWPCWDTFDV